MVYGLKKNLGSTFFESVSQKSEKRGSCGCDALVVVCASAVLQHFEHLRFVSSSDDLRTH